MDTIIAIWNAGSKGKSSTILALANLLLLRFPRDIIHSSKNVNVLTIDFRLIIRINGRVIALESQGDPNTGLENRLGDIITNPNYVRPNVIICSTRTRGETVWAIDNIAGLYDYETIWTSTYQTRQNHNVVNGIKAQHLLDLMTQLQLL